MSFVSALSTGQRASLGTPRLAAARRDGLLGQVISRETHVVRDGP
jgi:hypothetical protein